MSLHNPICYLSYLGNGLNPNRLIWKIYPIEVCAVVNKTINMIAIFR